MGRFCFGIDVGGTSVKCGLFKVSGELVEKWEIPTHTENNGNYILPDAAKSIQDKMAARLLSKEDVAGIGIGVPGPVKADGTVDVAVNIGWGYKDIIGEIQDLTGITAKAGNDANVAALGEMWKGGGEGYRNLILVTLGTGVGGGIIVDGKIITGAHGAGGEIGHARVDLNEEEVCNCTNRGCLEQKASATGIARLARRELAASKEDSVLREAEEVSAKAVFDAYKQQDALAVRIVEKFAEVLGNSLAIYACVVDPDVIVIGGGVSKAGQVLIDVVKRYFTRDAFPACRDTDIVLAQLGNDAGIYGAAKMILDA